MKTEYILKDQTIEIDNFNSDNEIIKNSQNRLKNITLENGKMEYCFNYALQDKKINALEDSCEILDLEFKIIPFKDIRKGDIVEFRDNYDTLHFGRVWIKRKSIADTIIRSKFGLLGIYEHKLKDTPSCYGHRVWFWRKVEIKKRANKKKQDKLFTEIGVSFGNN